jgi:hypothetical protein
VLYAAECSTKGALLATLLRTRLAFTPWDCIRTGGSAAFRAGFRSFETITSAAWWLGLRAIFQRYDTVTFSEMARTFECRDMASKRSANTEVKNWVKDDFRR